MTVRVRVLDPADLDAAFAINQAAFDSAASDQDRWQQGLTGSIEQGLALGGYDGGELLAMARARSFRQWWGGQDLAMGGIASVAVAPQARGRGLGRAVVAATLQALADQRTPVSALYPATAPLYRSLGWEVAGAQTRYRLSAAALPRPRRGTAAPVRLAGPADAPALATAAAALAARTWRSGPLRHGTEVWDQRLAEPGTLVYIASGADPAAPAAVAGYLRHRRRRRPADGGFDIDVSEVAAGTPAAARALWEVVGSAASVATDVLSWLAVDDPLPLLLAEPTLRVAESHPWMLRLVDAVGACAGRGYPPGVELDVALEVVDEQLPGNAGAWSLHVRAGQGSLERPGRQPLAAPALQLTVGGLAAVFAGFRPLSSLRLAGLATGGDPGSDAALDAAFGGCPPYLLDYF